MSENWAIALTVFCFTQFAACVSGVLMAFFILWRKMAENEVNSEHRLTVLEAKCERWFVLAGSNGLHSPDDHLGADKEIERFVMLYRKHNHDMPMEDWKYFNRFFKSLSQKIEATPNERALADGFWELCEHKLERFSKETETTHTKKIL